MTSGFARSISAIILLHFRVRDVNIGSFSEYMVTLYTRYRKIFSHFFQNSGAFITFNLSETLEGCLLGERRLLEEIRYETFLGKLDLYKCPGTFFAECISRVILK